MKIGKFAMTLNLIPYAKEMGLIVEIFRDIPENRDLGCAEMEIAKYQKLFDIGENIGGFITQFNPGLSEGASQNIESPPSEEDEK